MQALLELMKLCLESDEREGRQQKRWPEAALR
jgi:hypothetical protein